MTSAAQVEPAKQAEPKQRRQPRRAKSPEPEQSEQPVLEEPEEDEEDPQTGATALLQRALRLGHDRGGDDADWLHNSQVKEQMKRLDPSFSERRLGYRSFSDFLRSRAELVDLDESSTARLVRLASGG